MYGKLAPGLCRWALAMGTYDSVTLRDEDVLRIERCPGCDANCHDARVSHRHEFEFNRCRACDLFFMNPQPTPEFLSQFYSGEYWALTNSRRNFRERVVRQLRRGVVYSRLLRKWMVNLEGARILEIGSGLGGVVWSLTYSFGAQGFANEPDPEAQRILTRLQINLLSDQDLQASKISGTFKLVVLSHVLEHQPDPKPLLKNALNQVASDGALLIEVPNGNVLRDGGIEHPLVFSRQSLSALLSNFECEVKWATHDGPERVLFPPQYLTALVRPSSRSQGNRARRWVPHSFFEVRRSLYNVARRWGPLKGLDYRLAFFRRRQVSSELEKMEREFFKNLGEPVE